MKKVFLVGFILLLCGCTKTNVPTLSSDSSMIILKGNSNINFREEKSLYDIVEIKNGTILTEDYKIDTSSLKTIPTTIEYKDSNDEINEYQFDIKVVDNEAPQIFSSKKYSFVKGDKDNLSSKPLCGDNYTRNMKCVIVGDYDLNKIGEYPIQITATDEAGNYTYKDATVIVKEKEEKASSTISKIDIKDFIKSYKTDDTLIGVDVSVWQGNIDWNKVKKAGVSFAIIRIGYGHTSKNNLVMDSKFTRNIKEAKKAGLKVGVYFYSHAKNTKEAEEQAKWVVKNLKGEKLDLGVAFDWEIWSKFMSFKINFNDLNDIANAFLDTVKASGYEGLNYGSANYHKYIWNTPKYDTWLDWYTKNNTFEEKHYIWQATSSGKVPGISGRADLNVLYLK